MTQYSAYQAHGKVTILLRFKLIIGDPYTSPSRSGFGSPIMSSIYGMTDRVIARLLSNNTRIALHLASMFRTMHDIHAALMSGQNRLFQQDNSIPIASIAITD